MSAPTRTLTPAEAADLLGVAPARVRALVASGALPAVPDGAGTVAADDVEALQRRGVLRALDVAAVEGALDRALRRRLPDLLDAALQPVAGELATALADAEASGAAVAAAEARAVTAERELAAAQARIGVLEQQVTALQARPAGLFRRRRSAVAPA